MKYFYNLYRFEKPLKRLSISKLLLTTNLSWWLMKPQYDYNRFNGLLILKFDFL